MPNLLERAGSLIARSPVGTALLGEERRRLGDAFELMRDAIFVGPWALPPDQLVSQLREVDPFLLQDLIQQLGWESIGGLGGYGVDPEAERQRAVQQAKHLYKFSPLAQWSIWLLTGWGLGDRVVVTPNDKAAAKWWAEFWTADRNATLLGDDRLDDMSDFLLVTGERFLVYFANPNSGLATVRSADPTEIVAVLTNPEDRAEPWFYERRFDVGSEPRTVFYPDWQLYLDEKEGKVDHAWDALVQTQKAPADGRRSDDAASGVVSVMQFACHNRKDEGSLRGWPISLAAGPWLRSQQLYMENRLTSSTAIASTIKRYTIAGGSRAVAAVKARFQSTLGAGSYQDANPPPRGGTSELLNKAIEARDLPMRTGASDAKADNDMFTWMALLAMGVLPTSAGLDTARWATAVEMDKAQSMLFQSYQNFWAAQWRRSVKIVLGLAERFGGQRFEDKTAEVSVDSFSLSDFPKVAASIGDLARSALAPFVEAGVVPATASGPILQRLWRLSLQALGQTDEKLTSDEAFGLAAARGPASPSDGEEPEATTVERLAALVRENVRSGAIGQEDAGLWALAELVGWAEGSEP